MKFVFNKPVLIGDKTRQKSRNLWKNHKDTRRDNQCREEGEYPLKDSLNGYVRCNSLYDEYIDTDRRRDDPHLAGEHDDDPEPNRIKAEFHNDRKEDGNGHHNERHGVHKEAAHEIDEDEDDHNRHPVYGKSPEPV